MTEKHFVLTDLFLFICERNKKSPENDGSL